MRQSKSEKLGEIVNQILRLNGLETPLNQYRVIEVWKNTIGKSFEKYTENIFIKNQTLYIKLNSSTVRNELSMHQKTLTERINSEVKAQVIANIVFI
jgi:DNA-binding XRE family transcriptional regulator